ncbi:MAG: short-subunit dehydrogenase [Cyclobacteriaceae bacterium]|jgi:short-subunit dehydrogenase
MNRKNILITGASSGIGRGMALEFAKQGHNLALCARRVENLQALKEQIKELNPGVHVFTRSLDVSQAEQVFEVFKAFNNDFGQINETLDRVIVNAGIGKGGSLGKGFASANMQTAVTNFGGALSQFEAALEIFRAQESGHLVAISSMSAFRGYGRALNVYAATKAALKSLAEGVRVDLLHSPIKVSSIFPGFIETEMTDQMAKRPPFMIDGDKGAKLLVRAINKEKANAYVPFWPWHFFKLVMPFVTLSFLRKF